MATSSHSLSASVTLPLAEPAAGGSYESRVGVATLPVYLSVIVPVWNGADRLPTLLHRIRQLFERLPYAAELVLVDDCSGPETARFLADMHCDFPVRVYRNERNEGKGYSVARGMLAACGDLRVFTDADLAYPVEEIETVVDALERGHDVAIACRVHRESRYVMSPSFFPYLFTRHLLSRAFNGAVRRLLVSGVLDTQAGLKGFTREAAELIFPRLTIRRFGFDVECLYIAHRHRKRLAQVPVTFRYDDEPTSVKFVRDGARMLTDLLRVRTNAWRGVYD